MLFSPFTNIEPSATVAINSRAQQKQAAGQRVYNLSAGEPILPPHPTIIEGATTAIHSGKTLYPPIAGIPELRKAACDWMNKHYGTPYQIKNTLVTCGGKFGVFAACQALIKQGDQALIIAPYWVSYPEMVKLFGGMPRIIQTTEKNGWKIQLQQLQQFQDTNTIKLLLFNNAANPTGVLYTRDEISSILTWAKEKEVFVISDEVYSELAYDDHEYVSCGSFPEHRNHVVVIQSCSKHFAMTGWRVGFVFAPEDIINVLTMIQSQSTTGTSSISQWAALAAFQHASEIIPTVRHAMQTRRDVLMASLQELFNHSFPSPASALYMFIAMCDLGVDTNNSTEFCRRLIEEHNIAIVPGSAFGAEGYVRLSFGAPEKELQEAIAAFKAAIDRFSLTKK